MPKQIKEDNWKCEICGKDGFRTEGYCRRHEIQKHGKEGGQYDNRKCPDCGSENVRALNSRNKDEGIAIRHGFDYLCKNCEEVF
jgi:hypothetical protein